MFVYIRAYTSARVLSLTCPRTPALGHTSFPSSTSDPRSVVNNTLNSRVFIHSQKKSTPDARNRNFALTPEARPLPRGMKRVYIQSQILAGSLTIVLEFGYFQDKL